MLRNDVVSFGNWADLSAGLISQPGMSIVVPIPPASAVRISVLNQLGRIELGRIDVPAQLDVVDVLV